MAVSDTSWTDESDRGRRSWAASLYGRYRIRPPRRFWKQKSKFFQGADGAYTTSAGKANCQTMSVNGSSHAIRKEKKFLDFSLRAVVSG